MNRNTRHLNDYFLRPPNIDGPSKLIVDMLSATVGVDAIAIFFLESLHHYSDDPNSHE